MAIRHYNTQHGACGSCDNSGCSCNQVDGCPPGVCPDFTIRRNDTKPSLRICIDDCGEPVPLEGKVLEVNMWALGRLKIAIVTSTTSIALADNIGFFQVKIGDVLHLDHPRSPERMQVLSIDEDFSLITVQRGYGGTTARSWKRGEKIRIFRIINSPAICEMTYMDIQQIDGTIVKNQPTESTLVYDWQPGDTSLEGCYWLEFKLLKMTEQSLFTTGGAWQGPTIENSQKFFFTGSIMSDASVLVSYDAVGNQFFIAPGNHWTGPTHLYSDGMNYTGSSHNDGSVLLNPSGTQPLVVEDYALQNNFSSILPSPGLGLGVEWVQRFPTEGEGFLIRISHSPVTEI